VNRKKLREWVALMEELGIEELEIRSLFKRIKIVRSRRGEKVENTSPAAQSSPVEAPVEEKKEEVKEEFYAIKSPLVGTFYRAPAPGAEPFVKEGDIVEPGQVVAIVEAMKVMNEIEADRRGRVVKILVEDGEPVEYGQELIHLIPL
jgi:acetyl-CoA carboxylase biotin carboxyl carrier protein